MILNRDPINEKGGINLYQFAINRPNSYIDSMGKDVYVCTRYLDFRSRAAELGAHSFTQVIDKNENETTYTGMKDSPTGRLDIIKNFGADHSATRHFGLTSRKRIPPPQGMSQNDWDNAVKESAERERKKRLRREYKLLGGDSGETSGNCHTVTREIIEGAGGEVPPDYDPPGFNPDLNSR